MFPQSLLAEIIIPVADYPSIYKDQDLQDVIDTFLASRSSSPTGGLPLQDIIVLDSDNTLVGHISINDVLKSLEPKLLGTKINHFEGPLSDSSDISILWEEPFFQQCGKHMKTKVSEVYRPFDDKAKESDSILKILHVMLSQNSQLMPVKRANKIVGVIHLADVFSRVVNCCMMSSPGSTNQEKA